MIGKRSQIDTRSRNAWRGRLAPLAAVAMIAGAATSLQAQTGTPTAVPFGPDLTANGWQLMTFPRRTPVSFSAQGMDTLLIDANRAVAVLWRQLKPARGDVTSAQWRWKVESGVGPTDLSRKGGDDRAMAVYFVFSDEAAPNGAIDLSSVMRAGRAHIITYVWGGAAPKGQFLASPYLGKNARTVVLRSAREPSGAWVPERVDLQADFRTAFGTAAPALIAVAVSSDSDDTEGHNVAAISNLVLNPRGGPEKR